MDRILDRKHFRALFADRAIVVADLGPGGPRDLAARVNEAAGRGDAVLRTRAEYDALFDAVARDVAHAPADAAAVAMADDEGRPTPAGTMVHAYLGASIGKRELFGWPMCQVEISGWPASQLRPEEPVIADGSRLSLSRADPQDVRRVPPLVDGRVLFTSTTFSLMNSGQMTKYSPKRSWKVDLDPGDDDDRIVGMARLNLKSMYNDPSQMREALAWRLFAAAGVPSPRHTYARLVINGAYYGLHSLIEQIDKRFLGDRFGENRRGNLYKAYCGSLGCATLEHRRGTDGDDSGRQYHTSGHPGDQTYRLKTNENDAAVASYDDLATFIRVVNGVGLPGGDGRFNTDAFRAEVERVFDAQAFLRWAGVNLLLGSWDNYFASPANYYLYNGGHAGRARDFATDPYFTFLPWDYDNCLGIDYFGTKWQYADLLDWAAITRQYWHREGHRNHTSRVPLVHNLLANPGFAQYYLDHLDYLLATHFNPSAICTQMGTPDGDGLWRRVSQAAFLESDTPYGAAFTGRQFSNDEVYRAGYAQNELRHGNALIPGIYHYVKMRCDSATAQLQQLRRRYPAGASGVTFPTPGSIARSGETG